MLIYHIGKPIVSSSEGLSLWVGLGADDRRIVVVVARTVVCLLVVSRSRKLSASA